MSGAPAPHAPPWRRSLTEVGSTRRHLGVAACVALLAALAASLLPGATGLPAPVLASGLLAGVMASWSP